MMRRLRVRAARGPLYSAVSAWVVARVVVLVALALAHYLVSHLHPAAPVALRVHQGLLGWDAGFYRDIAARGYTALPRPALRFFPLLPILTRALHDLTRLSVNDCLLVITNACALAAGIALYRLVLRETGDERVASLSVWLLALAPPAYVLVMGYSEAPMILWAVVFFLGLRSGRWWLAAGAGYLAGLTRPVGALLAVPAAVEALGWGRRRAAGILPEDAEPDGRLRPDLPRSGPERHRVLQLLAVVAPVAGTCTYLGWVAARFGSFWLPLRVQVQGNLRGHFADPLATAWHDLADLGHGHIGTGLHVPWLVVFVLLALVSLGRWPTPYAAYALATLALAVSSTNFDSLERYALSAFPLVVAGAGLLRGERRERTAFTFLGALLLAYALLAFLNALVP